MSNNLSPIAGMIGKKGFVAVSASNKGAWKVAAIIKDVRSSFGRTDYLIEPVAPSTGPAVWVEAVRFKGGAL
jgi:hypothetical protein